MINSKLQPKKEEEKGRYEAEKMLKEKNKIKREYKSTPIN